MTTEWEVEDRPHDEWALYCPNCGGKNVCDVRFAQNVSVTRRVDGMLETGVALDIHCQICCYVQKVAVSKVADR